MGFFDRFRRGERGTASGLGERRTADSLGATFTAAGLGPGSGRDATSWAAVDMIASSMGNLTGAFHDRATKQSVKDHPLDDLLARPNQDETRFQFLYASVRDYFDNGNVYWYKWDNGDGETVALFRVDPNKVTVKRGAFNRKVFVLEGREYGGDKILHIPSRYGYDGLKGRSVFSECAHIFRLSSELDDFVNNSFNNGVGNRLVIDITKGFPDASDDDIRRIREKFIQNYAGVRNAGKPIIKSNKVEYGTIDTKGPPSNQANQLLENRQHQEREVAKLFGIPLSLLNGTETANIESLYILYIEGAIRPIATQFEQSINRLLPQRQRGRMYYEFSYNSLMKTSLTSRINSYARQLTNAVLSPNEIRRKENLPEVEGGDTLFLPSNLMPLRPDVIDAYMAGAKLKLAEMNTDSPGTAGNHSSLGDDKGA